MKFIDKLRKLRGGLRGDTEVLSREVVPLSQVEVEPGDIFALSFGVEMYCRAADDPAIAIPAVEDVVYSSLDRHATRLAWLIQNRELLRVRLYRRDGQRIHILAFPESDPIQIATPMPTSIQ